MKRQTLQLRPLCCLVAVSLLGCAGVRKTPAPRVSLSPGWAVAVEPSRSLFRVGYQGPEGSGTLRLALLVAAANEYQARASDRFGRALWSLALAERAVTFVDHRRRRFCVGDLELRIPELSLGALSLDRLPAVLEGQVPASAAGGDLDPRDFRDAEGRRWTVERVGGQVQTWALWSDEEPLVWWRRQREGGILSHREGAQFRWRRSLREPLELPLEPLAAPGGYRRSSCDELRLRPDPEVPAG